MKKILQIKVKPKRDWNILVLVFGLVLIVVSAIAWQIYLSNKIGGGYIKFKETDAGSDLQGLDIKKIEAVLNIVNEKEKVFSEIERGKTNLIDPSK